MENFDICSISNRLIITMISMRLLSLFMILCVIVGAEPTDDRLSQIPGYPSSFQNRAFAGYLNTDS